MKKLIIATFLLACLGISVRAADSQTASPTFRNPVLWADVPDPDVIRVGNDFYLVSTTMHLMPCHWEDGWPMLGDPDGKVPTDMPVPCQGEKQHNGIVTSDEFNASTLSLNWQWNHNPIDEAWPLTDRKGWLRLHTSRPANHIFDAPNTISQRMMGPTCTGIVKMDLGGMREGDRAGLSAFNGDAVQLMASRQNGHTLLFVEEASVKFSKSKKIEQVSQRTTGQKELHGDIVYLRIDADFNPGKDIASLSYSTDGTTWHKLGEDFKMKYDFTRLFMGSRFAIFNYTTEKPGGHVDIDWFHFSCGEK